MSVMHEQEPVRTRRSFSEEFKGGRGSSMASWKRSGVRFPIAPLVRNLGVMDEPRPRPSGVPSVPAAVQPVSS